MLLSYICMNIHNNLLYSLPNVGKGSWAGVISVLFCYRRHIAPIKASKPVEKDECHPFFFIGEAGRT